MLDSRPVTKSLVVHTILPGVFSYCLFSFYG